MSANQLTSLIAETLSFIPWQTALQPTLQAKDVSVVLHEPAILGGYRVPYKPWTYYFFSLFQLHNETFNVWSHLIGIMLVLNRFYGYFQEFSIGEDRIMAVLIPFGLSGIISMFISASVHLLHARSPYTHFVGFMIDYIGAAVCPFGYGIAFFYGLSDFKTYHAYKDMYLIVITIVSFINFVIMCVAKILYGHDPHNMKRKYMMLGGMVSQAVINFLPVVPRYESCYHDEKCSMSSLNHITIIPIVFLLQAVTFAAHQPECTWPGKFDILGHGHQAFHVLIVVNSFITMNSIYDDYAKGITSENDPDLGVLLCVLVALILMQAAVLKYLVRYVPQALKRFVDESAHN